MAGGARIFVSSIISQERLEYTVPALLAVAEFNATDPVVAGTHETYFGAKSIVTPSAPLAAIVATRGRTTLSAGVLSATKAFLAIEDKWHRAKVASATLRAMHAQLLGRNIPSMLRDSSVWVDGLRPRDAGLIPCPSSMVPAMLEDYSAFMSRSDLSSLIRLAIGHYQLLMIHPFFDGNGRLSRLVALLQAQRFLPRAQAMVVAAALAIQRRALRPLLDRMRQGDVDGYLQYWSTLLSWSASATTTIANLADGAKNKLVSIIGSGESSQRVARFLLDEPIFDGTALAMRLNISPKLAASKLAMFSKDKIVEPHCSGPSHYRCPIAVEFWRDTMQSIANGCAELLPPESRVTNPSL